MRNLALMQPSRIVIGEQATETCVADALRQGRRRIFVVTSPPLLTLVEPVAAAFRQAGAEVVIHDAIAAEPTVRMLDTALAAARSFHPDLVMGLGGGSALDAAKFVAALAHETRPVNEFFGPDKLPPRQVGLVCLPTTSGTGSEVSPNAILLDEADQLKKASISPYLVPDAAYLDPGLTRSMPPAITAATGMDALTHCIEAFANLNAHPAVDLYALEGIRLVGRHLRRAVAEGQDLVAREGMAMASLYGGLCLGPVNTAAVHALAYPLGGAFHVAHGVANAVMLPHVLAFNLPAMPERYARIAEALGAIPGRDAMETAERGIALLRDWSRLIGIPPGLASLGIPAGAIPALAASAMTVTRLLKNNPRPVMYEDALGIYRAALWEGELS